MRSLAAKRRGASSVNGLTTEASRRCRRVANSPALRAPFLSTPHNMSTPPEQRATVIGDESGPSPPFPLKIAGPVISGFGRGSREVRYITFLGSTWCNSSRLLLDRGQKSRRPSPCARFWPAFAASPQSARASHLPLPRRTACRGRTTAKEMPACRAKRPEREAYIDCLLYYRSPIFGSLMSPFASPRIIDSLDRRFLMHLFNLSLVRSPVELVLASSASPPPMYPTRVFLRRSPRPASTSASPACP